MGSSVSLQADNLEYADECVQKGVAARDRRNFKAAQRWFEEALKIRELVYGPSADVNYAEPYVSVLILIGEVHLWRGSIERGLFYLLRASELLDAKMDLPSIRRTTAVTQFVNVTAGLVLVLNRIATDPDMLKRHDAATLRAALAGTHPLDMAEAQLHRAIQVVSSIEGTRSATLIPLFHMLARVFMSRRKVMHALRVMQRCLGLTLHVAQTKQIFSFLSYTRNVLDAIKGHAHRDAAAIKIQQWWRERRALALDQEAAALGVHRHTSEPAIHRKDSHTRVEPAMVDWSPSGSVNTDPRGNSTSANQLRSGSYSNNPRNRGPPPLGTVVKASDPPPPAAAAGPSSGRSGAGKPAAADPQHHAFDDSTTSASEGPESARSVGGGAPMGSARDRVRHVQLPPRGDVGSSKSDPTSPASNTVRSHRAEPPMRVGSRTSLSSEGSPSHALPHRTVDATPAPVAGFDVPGPDILNLPPDAVTHRTGSAGLPGSMDDDELAGRGGGAHAERNVYTTLNHVNSNISSAMKLWKVDDEGTAAAAAAAGARAPLNMSSESDVARESSMAAVASSPASPLGVRRPS